MAASKKKAVSNQVPAISGNKVKRASRSEVKLSSGKMKTRYARALENLKNR